MHYNIVIVADERYIQHSAVMLTSLFCTNREKKFIIYLLTDGISLETEAKFREVCTNYNAQLKVIKCSIENLGDFPIGQWQPIMYFKLLIPQLLPSSEDRCLFLDGDMIVYDDIKPLYFWNLEDKVIAAAEDIPDCIAFKSRLGLKATDICINSGVMVCDLIKWRKMEHTLPIMEYASKIIRKIVNEQDVLACYFQNKIALLPIRWNMTTFYFFRSPKIFDKYLPELNISKRNPGIIHFAAPIKPWFKDCQHPYRRTYAKYLKLTPWKGSRFPIFEQLTLWGRIKKMTRNFLNEIGFLSDPMFTPYIKSV